MSARISALSDDEIRVLWVSASPGPWEREGNSVHSLPTGGAGHWVTHKARVADAKFIAAARELVPELLKRAARAERKIAVLSGEVERLQTKLGRARQLEDAWNKGYSAAAVHAAGLLRTLAEPT